MAEIPVERRPAMPLWAAIMGLLALIATVWMLFSLGADGQTAGSAGADSQAGLAPVVLVAA